MTADKRDGTVWYAVRGFETRYVMNGDGTRVHSLASVTRVGMALRCKDGQELKKNRYGFFRMKAKAGGQTHLLKPDDLLGLKGEAVSPVFIAPSGDPSFWERRQTPYSGD